MYKESKLYGDIITKPCLYNFNSLKPHYYIVKLGFTGFTLFFLFLLKKIDCGYFEAVLTCTHNLCSEQKYGECQNFLSEKISFLVVKFSEYLNRHVFVLRYLSPTVVKANKVELSFLILFKRTTMRRSSGYIEPSGKLAALLCPSVWCKRACDHDVLISEFSLYFVSFKNCEISKHDCGYIILQTWLASPTSVRKGRRTHLISMNGQITLALNAQQHKH